MITIDIPYLFINRTTVNHQNIPRSIPKGAGIICIGIRITTWAWLLKHQNIINWINRRQHYRCSIWRRREFYHTNMTMWIRQRNMYHRIFLEKWGLDCRYHTRIWNGISVRFQYDTMRRGISIYTPCRDLYLLKLRLLLWRQLIELFFRILARFNFDIAICRWRAIQRLYFLTILETQPSVPMY